MLNDVLATNLRLTQDHTTVSPNMKHFTLATLKPRMSVTISSTQDVTRNGRQVSSHSEHEAIVIRGLQASLSSCRRDAQHSHKLHATLSFIPDKLTATQLVKKFPTFVGQEDPISGSQRPTKLTQLSVAIIQSTPSHPTFSSSNLS
jgi:hypothetical protein